MNLTLTRVFALLLLGRILTHILLLLLSRYSKFFLPFVNCVLWSSNLQSSEPFCYLTDWSVNYIQGISPRTWLFHRETFRSHYRRRFYKADTMTSKGIGFDVFFYGFIEVFLFFFDQVVMPFVFMIALPEMVAQTVFHGCNLIRNLLPNCLTSPWRMFQQFRSYLLTPTVENLGPLSLYGRNIHEH